MSARCERYDELCSTARTSFVAAHVVEVLTQTEYRLAHTRVSLARQRQQHMAGARDVLRKLREWGENETSPKEQRVQNIKKVRTEASVETGLLHSP